MVQATCRYASNRESFTEGESQREVMIDHAYMDMAMPIIQRRIAQAGIRLAHILNLALDPAYRAALL